MFYLFFRETFSVGSLVIGKDTPNAMKKGRIIAVIGNKRSIRYTVLWENGVESNELKTSLWRRTEEEQSDISTSDEEDGDKQNISAEIDGESSDDSSVLQDLLDPTEPIRSS